MEFLGTFFLVLAVACKAGAFSIGAMLMAWLFIGAYISGSHYNPVVSWAMMLQRKLSSRLLIGYVLAQLCGGFCAFGMAAFLKATLSFPAPGLGVTWLQAFVVEILLSFVFALIVLTVAIAKRYQPNFIFGFAIALTVPALAAVGGPISGGLFNPAIAVGSALYGLVSGTHSLIFSDLMMYLGGALIGSTLASWAFSYFNQN